MSAHGAPAGVDRSPIERNDDVQHGFEHRAKEDGLSSVALPSALGVAMRT
jgi:hypothetical protein